MKLSDAESAIYGNCRKQSINEGEENTHQDAEKEFKITYLCKKRGELMEMKPGDKDQLAMMQYIKEHGWKHGVAN